MAEEHRIVHRNPLGEAVCSCGEMFEPGTLTAYWPVHIARAAVELSPSTTTEEAQR